MKQSCMLPFGGTLLILTLFLAFNMNMVKGLSGGYQVPLSWGFSFGISLLISAFSIYFIGRLRNEQVSKLSFLILFFSLATVIGLIVGYNTSSFGVIGHKLQDPSSGQFSLIDSLFYSAWGGVGGEGIGFVSIRLYAGLRDAGLNPSNSLIISFASLNLVAFSSIFILLM